MLSNLGIVRVNSGKVMKYFMLRHFEAYRFFSENIHLLRKEVKFRWFFLYSSGTDFVYIDLLKWHRSNFWSTYSVIYLEMKKARHFDHYTPVGMNAAFDIWLSSCPFADWYTGETLSLCCAFASWLVFPYRADNNTPWICLRRK